MEPSNLNSSSPDEARLEAWLRRSTPELADHDFSARVLASLPATAAQRGSWRRLAVCILGAAAGCGFAIWQRTTWPGMQAEAEQFATALIVSGSSLVTPLFGGAMVVTALSLLMAFSADLKARLFS